MKKLTVLICLAIAALTATAALASTKTFTVGDNYFVRQGKPPVRTVTRGTVVRWVWKGKLPHNVTVTSGPTKFHSKTQLKGSFSRKLTKKGTYKILCTIHQPNMAMTVIVR